MTYFDLLFKELFFEIIKKIDNRNDHDNFIDVINIKFDASLYKKLFEEKFPVIYDHVNKYFYDDEVFQKVYIDLLILTNEEVNTMKTELLKNIDEICKQDFAKNAWTEIFFFITKNRNDSVVRGFNFLIAHLQIQKVFKSYLSNSFLNKILLRTVIEQYEKKSELKFPDYINTIIDTDLSKWRVDLMFM